MNYINLENVMIETVLMSKIYAVEKNLVFLSTIQNKNLTNAVKIFNIIIIFENFICKFCFHINIEDCL